MKSGDKCIYPNVNFLKEMFCTLPVSTVQLERSVYTYILNLNLDKVKRFSQCLYIGIYS